MRRYFYILSILVSAIVYSLGLAAAPRDDQSDDMLVITSYSQSYRWSSRIITHMERYVAKDCQKKITTINVPLVGINKLEVLDSVTTALKTAIISKPPKAVTLVGSSAFILCEDLNKWFPDVPMILIGGQEITSDKRQVIERRVVTKENVITTEQLHKKYNVTSQCTPVYMAENLNLICTLLPNLENLYYIGGDDQFSRTKNNDLHEALLKSHPRLKYHRLESGVVSTDSMLVVLRSLNPKTDAVIFSSWLSYQSYKQANMTMNNAIYFMEASKAPTFTMRDNGWLDERANVIGGYFLDEDHYYKSLDKVVSQIFAGVPARDIPFYNQGKPIVKLDYDLLTRFGIDPSLCPAGTVFVHKPDTFWKQYGKYLSFVAAVMLIMILLLMLIIARKNLHVKELRIKELEINRQHSNLIENMPIVYYRAKVLKDADGKIKDLEAVIGNKKAIGLFKGDMHGEMGKSLHNLMPKSTPVLIKSLEAAAEKGERETSMVVDVWTGEYYIMHVVVDGDNIDCFCINISDTINYQRELEVMNAQLKEAKEAAEMSERIKSEFIQNMSHEIRTPLNAICGFSEMLTNPDFADGLMPEEKKEYAGIISTNSEVLMTLVNDILDFSDLDSGRAIIEKRDATVNDMLRVAMRSVELRMPEGVALKMDTDVDDSATVFTDPKRIQQVLVNYLTNAIKHTEEGSITVGFRHEVKPGWCEFSVTDTGVGVPADKAEEIFERFEKLNNYKQGTGLGLAICKSTARLLDGEVALDTSYTGGARFVFRLRM